MTSPERGRGRLDHRTDRPGGVDWIGVHLGAGLITFTVIGTVLVSLLDLRWGQYALAAALLVSLVITLGWYGAESFLRTQMPVYDDGWK